MAPQNNILRITLTFSNDDKIIMEVGQQHFVKRMEWTLAHDAKRERLLACYSLEKDQWLSGEHTAEGWKTDLSKDPEYPDAILKSLADEFISRSVDFEINSIRGRKVEDNSVKAVTYSVYIPELEKVNPRLHNQLCNRYLPYLMHTQTYFYDDDYEVTVPARLVAEEQPRFSDDVTGLIDIDELVLRNTQ